MRKSNLLRYIRFFVSFVIIPISAYGQGYQSFWSMLEQVSKITKYKVGPFWIFPAFQFKNIGYDDNVYYQRQEDDPASDFTGTISPQVKVYFLFRHRLILSLTENPEYVYYFEQKRERSLNNTFSPAFRCLFFKRFVLSGSYFSSSQRRRASSEFDVRANERVKSYDTRLFYETTRRTSFGFFGSVRRISYEDIALPGEEIYLSRALNREERSGSFEFYYRVLAESSIFMSGGFTEYEFEHPQSSWRNSVSYQAYSGIRFPLLGRVRGTFSLGYKRLAPRSEKRAGFSGLVGNTGLEFRVRRFLIRLNYERDCHFSYWTDNIFFNEDKYGGGLSFYLTKFLRIDYQLSYAEADYPEPTLLGMPDGSYKEIVRKDIYRSHAAGFVFRVKKNTGIGLSVNFWERESNYYWENRSRLFIGGYYTFDF